MSRLPSVRRPGRTSARLTSSCKDFRFGSGETLPELRIHYLTLGTAKKERGRRIVNGVLLLHGTSGSSTSWLQPTLANELFGKGQPLDASEVFPHHSRRHRRGQFAASRATACAAGFRTTATATCVEAAAPRSSPRRSVSGTCASCSARSMGGMQTWMWGEMYPDFMDGLVPIASQPIAISGRNWITRRIRIEAIRNDPDWNGGNYEKNPTTYIYTLPLAAMITESVVRLQEMAPTREAADELYQRLVEEAQKERREQPALRDRSGDGLRSVKGSREDQARGCSPSTLPTTRCNPPRAERDRAGDQAHPRTRGT